MDWSTRKKLGCFGIMAVVATVIIGFFVYKFFLSTPATCSDNKQNQNERGIDCGGICSRVCPMDARTIVPLWSRVFKITPGVYSAVAYVENQNLSAGVAKINYEFRVYDSENILAAEPITGSTFVGPNERTAIFETPIKTGNRIPSVVFFKWTNVPDWITVDKKYSVPQLTSENRILTDEDTVPKLSADIVNKTLYDYKNIEVVAILYGDDGNAVNASQTILDSIPQQTTQKVYFSWPGKFDTKVARIEVIPRINPFEQK